MLDHVTESMVKELTDELTRKKYGTLKNLAAALGVNERTVSRWRGAYGVGPSCIPAYGWMALLYLKHERKKEELLS